MVFLDLRFLRATAEIGEIGWGLGFVYNIVLSLITLYFYIRIFSIETTIRNALKGGKLDRNHTNPLVS
jgi:hypothetical protein